MNTYDYEVIGIDTEDGSECLTCAGIHETNGQVLVKVGFPDGFTCVSCGKVVI